MWREEGSGWGTHVYLWQIHFDIWQNQYNIVKLNKIKLKKTNKQKTLCLVYWYMTHIGPVRVKPKIFISSIGKEVEFALELLIFLLRHKAGAAGDHLCC